MLYVTSEMMFLDGSAPVFLLLTGPVLSGKAFANICLFVSDFLGYLPSDPMNSVNAKYLELQMKSLEVADNLFGEKNKRSSSDDCISHFVWCEQLINENAVK